MIKPYVIASIFLSMSLFAVSQIAAEPDTTGIQIDFISDTQQPMRVEKILLRSHNNLQATALLFSEILNTRPKSLYMLGDIVSLGYKKSKWKLVDIFLDSCRKNNISVYGVLGNHDLMGFRKKGERNFNKRYPDNVRTGYVSITDSMAIVLLNSNFGKLSSADKKKADEWYRSVLHGLDSSSAIKAVIVACHHAPYTNSLTVGSSKLVQKYFVPPFMNARKAILFITGHSHSFEHFKITGKDFLVIGGGGGLHQPLNSGLNKLPDLAADYKPLFHYLSVKRMGDHLEVISHPLKDDFSGFDTGHNFTIQLPTETNPQPSR